jgi:hypothetical protein
MHPLPAVDLYSEKALFLYLKELNNEVQKHCMFLIEFSTDTDTEPEFVISFHCTVCLTVARRLLLRKK